MRCVQMDRIDSAGWVVQTHAPSVLKQVSARAFLDQQLRERLHVAGRDVVPLPAHRHNAHPQRMRESAQVHCM